MTEPPVVLIATTPAVESAVVATPSTERPVVPVTLAAESVVVAIPMTEPPVIAAMPIEESASD